MGDVQDTAQEKEGETRKGGVERLQMPDRLQGRYVLQILFPISCLGACWSPRQRSSVDVEESMPATTRVGGVRRVEWYEGNIANFVQGVYLRRTKEIKN